MAQLRYVPGSDSCTATIPSDFCDIAATPLRSERARGVASHARAKASRANQNLSEAALAGLVHK